MKDLTDVRREISEIDATLAPLLARRLRLADDVAEAKRALGRSVDDPVREQAVLEAVTTGVDADLVPGVRSVYAAVFKASKARQSDRLAEA